jgi:hypothetical protein
MFEVHVNFDVVCIEIQCAIIVKVADSLNDRRARTDNQNDNIQLRVPILHIFPFNYL